MSRGTRFGSSAGAAPPGRSRPRRNGRRSDSDRSRTRTMCGVSVSTMSVSCDSAPVAREQPPDEREIDQPRDAREHRALVVADQSGQHVRLAVLQPDRRGDFTIAERRQPAEATSRDVAQRHLERQRHVVVVVRARQDVDVHADVLVDERRDRLLVDASRRDWRKRRHRHRHAVAEAGLGGDPFRRAELRVRERARIRVVLEQPVVDRRHAGDEDIGAR